MSDNPSSNSKSYIKLRHCVLKMLYILFQEFPYASIELGQIAEECRTDAGELNWNIVYLEKCGYVELSRSSESPPYVASSVNITAKGIDLVEDESEFKRRFPVDYDKGEGCKPK